MSHRWGRADSDISVSQNFCRIQRSWLVHMSTASADCAVLLKTLTSLQPPDGKDCCAIEGIVCQNGRLVQVNLGYKGLKGVLPEFSELTELQSFVVPGNALTGVMPDSLASLSKLTTLDIGLNTISGTIPPTLPKSLMELYVGYNHLTGNIPSFLGSLNQLQVLYLSNNTFSGGIPTTFGQLAQLSRLHMAFNQLTGSIPTELSLLSKLAQMDLDNNNLTGPIPTELLNLPSSAYIHLQQNLLSGTIPTSFFDRKLNISGNCFDGQTGHNPACGTLPSPPTTSKLNGVLIGGIVVGAVALLLIAGGIFLYFRRSRNPSKDNSSPSLPNADSVTAWLT
ncbi:hypothetical protein BC830DRAFT_265725 [Chytriomyces sp. MP71]|nr:hypothetical protein BC830DRAFT_265725 [Chytriomyces sp. MP71]